MKYFIGLVSLSFFSCNQAADKTQILEARIDHLEKQLNETYKPGFGEFMRSIQAHHAKLWFAGQNKNWELADFETHELMETIEDIGKFQKERKESQKIGMIFPALDSINKAISDKNLERFNRHYTQLTNTCNACHRATEFEFNIVKTPNIQPFTNQDFKINP